MDQAMNDSITYINVPKYIYNILRVVLIATVSIFTTCSSEEVIAMISLTIFIGKPCS